MNLTEEEKYENYLMLQKSLQELRSRRRVTDDWEQSHYQFFLKIREHFTDFNLVAPTITNSVFRKICYEAEQLATYIETQILTSGMNYNMYKTFLERIEYIIKYYDNIGEEDELSDLMGKIRM